MSNCSPGWNVGSCMWVLILWLYIVVVVCYLVSCGVGLTI